MLVFRGHHRQLRLLFGASDILLIAIAFRIAYWMRSQLELEHNFFIRGPEIAVLLGWSMLVWVVLGYWWEIYDRIDASDPRTILRDAFQQCLLGSGLVVLFEYSLRLDLSRSFAALFALLTWFLLCLFRLNAGRILAYARRGRTNYVMVVGVGEAALRLGRELEDAATY